MTVRSAASSTVQPAPGRVLWTSARDGVRLGDRLGGGGEGEVFEVVSRPDLVAKIYTGAVSPDRIRKLAAMTRMAREAPDLLTFCAWPIDTLHWRSPVGDRDGCTGFLMPRISGRKEIHHLTSPPTRKKEFPDKGWSFQIHVAWNLAAAVDTIHDAGVVVGDINERGFLVGPDGTLRVIDCDSFQIRHGGQVYRCEVGVADYTPPELQNLAGGFASVVRSANHDAFGLAIVIFKLLFQGRHPFMGRFSGTGEPDLQRFIREYRFAYSPNAGAKQIAPPPHSLHLGALTPGLASLFERTFAESAVSGGRAVAKEWLEALGALRSRLTTCRANDGHHYLKDVGRCPWCVIELSSGIVFFFGRVTVQGTGWSLNVGYFSAAIDRLPDLAPGGAPINTPTPDPQSLPGAVLQAAKRNKKLRYVVTGTGVAIGLLAGVFSGLTAVGVLIGTVLALIAWNLVKRSGPLHDLIGQQERAHRAARARLREMQEQWGQLPLGAYRDERRKVQDELRQYAALDGRYQRAIAELERKKHDLQLQDHLDDFNIADEKIPLIGPARLATLSSFGITTAAEVTAENLQQVRGYRFGPATIQALLAWRRDKEARFRFDPSRPTDPRELATLMQRLHGERQSLETSMNRRLAGLSRLAGGIRERRERLGVDIITVARDVAQLEANLKHARAHAAR